MSKSTIATVGVVFAFLGCAAWFWVSSRDLTRQSAELSLRNLLQRPEHGAPRMLLSLRSINEAFLVSQGHRLSPTELRTVGEKLDQLIAMSDADFAAATRDIERPTFNSHFKSQLGTFRPYAVQDLRKFVASGLVKGAKWSLTDTAFGTQVIWGVGVIRDELRSLCGPDYQDGVDCSFQASSKVLVEVTGIRGSDDVRLVQYQIEIRPTEFSMRLANLWPADWGWIGTGQLQNRAAIFARFDDGWRVNRHDLQYDQPKCC